MFLSDCWCHFAAQQAEEGSFTTSPSHSSLSPGLESDSRNPKSRLLNSAQRSAMSSSSPPGSAAAGVGAPKRRIGFVRNVMKNKHNFIQFFAMTGILLLSIRSMGQKYRIHDLLEDTSVLKDEEKSLSDRINHIKTNLFHEASLDSTGNFASRLRALFGDDQ